MDHLPFQQQREREREQNIDEEAALGRYYVSFSLRCYFLYAIPNMSYAIKTREIRVYHIGNIKDIV